MRHDLGLDGEAIRRMAYMNGRKATREYYERGQHLISRELFDADGHITHWTTYGADGRETNSWQYDKGMPIRQRRKGREYVKQGDRFGFFQEGRFIETPRGAISQ